MDELNEILETASSRIELDYFQLKIDGSGPIYRERVYCYELYHQMRVLWPEATPYFLNGEVDKRAHPILAKRDADGPKPDLLVHQPGDMRGNYTVVEVKSAEARRAGLRKDLSTLKLFRETVEYKRAIYLVYGSEAERLVATIADDAANVPELPEIELWIHATCGEPAHCVATLGEERDGTAQ